MLQKEIIKLLASFDNLSAESAFILSFKKNGLQLHNHFKTNTTAFNHVKNFENDTPARL